MGIIRAIKSSELGGVGDEPIYPVTSVRAIYDLNNKALDTIIEEHNTSISNTSKRTSVLEETINKVNISIDSIKNVLNNLQGNINTILSTVQTLESTVALKNNQNNYIVAKVTVGDSVTRGLPENTNHNLSCYSLIKEGGCVINGYETSYILNIKDGEIIIPTKPGEYIIDNLTLKVTDCSLIQKLGKDFVVISLGIPFIPIPTKNDIDKTLKVAENGSLYWG